MFTDDNTSKTLKAYGSVFKWGSGLLGKSAIVIGFLLLCVFAAVCRLHSDVAIVGVILLAAVFYFIWYFPLIRFCDKHPAEALLDGQHWAEHQQVLLTVKGKTPIALNSSPVPGAEIVIQKAEQSEGAPQ